MQIYGNNYGTGPSGGMGGRERALSAIRKAFSLWWRMHKFRSSYVHASRKNVVHSCGTLVTHRVVRESYVSRTWGVHRKTRRLSRAIGQTFCHFFLSFIIQPYGSDGSVAGVQWTAHVGKPMGFWCLINYVCIKNQITRGKLWNDSANIKRSSPACKVICLSLLSTPILLFFFLIF